MGVNIWRGYDEPNPPGAKPRQQIRTPPTPTPTPTAAAGLWRRRASVALATAIHSRGMETLSLRVVRCTTTNEKTTRLFSSSRVVSVRMG